MKNVPAILTEARRVGVVVVEFSRPVWKDGSWGFSVHTVSARFPHGFRTLPKFMFVLKRNGAREVVQFDKIARRLQGLSTDLEVEAISLAQQVVNGVRPEVSTSDVDHLAAESAANRITTHPDYDTLAVRLFVSNLHKKTSGSFGGLTRTLYNHHHHGVRSPMVSTAYYEFVQTHQQALEDHIQYTRDYHYDYFGLKTLDKGYLLKIHHQTVERPQDLLLRVACSIHLDSLEAALETYTLLSEKWFIHASPTLFNAGTPNTQLASCFLLTMKEDSVDGIFDTLKQCAQISKCAGGIGLSVSSIRAAGSYIRGTNGTSNGIIPMLRVFNTTARYVDQGGGKRKGAFAIYLEPWHADILDFLDLRKNTGVEDRRTRDLFLGLWIPDLFMRRVSTDSAWSLFCPDTAPGLCEAYGEAFDKLYTEYEADPRRVRTTLQARTIWNAILESQVETGVPYMLYKDACNQKSNQKNLGTIRGSNLCTEIIEYTAPDETAVCTLGSVALSKFVRDGSFDHGKLESVCRVLVRNLNKIIDRNVYPVPEAQRSNLRHRPMGIGVQGLADVFALLGIPFESTEAKVLNRDIFETMYFAACSTSMELAREQGPYETYHGSPMSEGQFQFDLWGVSPSCRWDWDTLRADIALHGVRNSLLVAPMPTASTSQILGNNECSEPFTSNLYVRRTLAGEFVCINRHLTRDLLGLGLWTPQLKDRIIKANGSIQALKEIPSHLRAVYKTVWEIDARCLQDLAADRGPFIDQSQSLNLYMTNVNFSKLTAMHFHGWKRGLKTGMYYLRTQAAAEAIQFTIPSLPKEECVSCSG